MKNKFKTTAILLSAIVSSVTLLNNANAGTCSGDTCSDVKITRIYPNANGSIYIGTDGDESQVCNTQYGYLQLYTSHQGFDVTYKLLLAMFLSGKSVTIKANSGSSCTVNYVFADA